MSRHGWYGVNMQGGLGDRLVTEDEVNKAKRAVYFDAGGCVANWKDRYSAGCPLGIYLDGAATPSLPGNRKTTAGKVPMANVPLDSLAGVANVLDTGNKKYGQDNWREPLPQGDTVRHYVSAALRHLAACQVDPKAVDKDSGLLHIDHAVTSLLIASHHTQKGSK